MIPEQELIAACGKSRRAYEFVQDCMDIQDWSPLAKKVWQAVDKFYRTDPDVTSLDWNHICRSITRKIETKEHKEQIETWLREISLLEISAENIRALALEARKDAVGMKLAEALLNGSDHSTQYLEEYQRLLEAEDVDDVSTEEYVNADVDEILDAIDPSAKIPVYPASLNQRLGGGLVRGDSIILFGRPEAGKTAVCVSLTAGFIAKGYRVLYMGNEDALKKIVKRLLSCLTGQPTGTMLQDPKRTMELARAKGYDKAIFSRLNPGTPKQVRALTRKHKPDIIILDQLRNLNVQGENRTNELEAAAQALRTIGGEFGAATIGVTQSGESGEGKLRLSMADIDSSKTGIQGACDIMLAVGVDSLYEQSGMRMLGTPKNKNGPHDYWPVKIRTDISRIEDES